MHKLTPGLPKDKVELVNPLFDNPKPAATRANAGVRHGAAVTPSVALRGQQLVEAAASGDDKLVASLLKVRRQSRCLVQHPCSR